MMTKEISVNEEDAVDMVEAGKEKVFEESDEDREKVVAMNGDVFAMVPLSSMKFENGQERGSETM